MKNFGLSWFFDPPFMRSWWTYWACLLLTGCPVFLWMYDYVFITDDAKRGVLTAFLCFLVIMYFIAADIAIEHPVLKRPNNSGVDFSGHDLSGANFRYCRLHNANFSGCDLTNANFRYADLTGANFGDAQLDGADFHGAQLSGAKMNSPIRTIKDVTKKPSPPVYELPTRWFSKPTKE